MDCVCVVRETTTRIRMFRCFLCVVHRSRELIKNEEKQKLLFLCTHSTLRSVPLRLLRKHEWRWEYTWSNGKIRRNTNARNPKNVWCVCVAIGVAITTSMSMSMENRHDNERLVSRYRYDARLMSVVCGRPHLTLASSAETFQHYTEHDTRQHMFRILWCCALIFSVVCHIHQLIISIISFENQWSRTTARTIERTQLTFNG